MKLLALYLWKEWRDHRAVLLGFLAAFPILPLLALLLLPPALAGHARIAPLAAAAGACILLLSVVAELIPGEARRGTIPFLARIPGGLSAAFRAKLLFLVIVLAGAALYAFLAAWAILRPDRVDFGQTHGMLWILALGLWVLPVSAWLPRGALAVPGTVLLFGLLALPIILLTGPSRFPPRNAWTPGVLQLHLLLGALWAARASFVRGYSFGRGPAAAAGRGLLVVAILALPSYAWTASRLRQERAVDPRAPDFHVYCAFLGEGGRLAFLNTARYDSNRDRYGALHTIVLDLASKEWTQEAETPYGFSPESFAERGAQHAILRRPEGDVVNGDVWVRYLDGKTGNPLRSGWRSQEPAEFTARARDVGRSMAPFRRADGGRVWPFRGVWQQELPDGSVAAIADLPWPGRGGAGLGFACDATTVFDFARGRMVQVPAGYEVRVRPGMWLLSKAIHRGREHVLFDPETGERSPAPGLGGTDAPGPVNDDGRVFVADQARGRISLLVPETGERSEVTVFDARHELFTQVSDPAPCSWPLRTPGGARVVRVAKESGVWWYARYDPRTQSLLRATGAVGSGATELDLVAFVDDDWFLVVRDHRELVRMKLGGGQCQAVEFGRQRKPGG
ncbi:MAG: hypothetical protein ACT4PV_09125 [Planctomycetaceae bacterium]